MTSTTARKKLLFLLISQVLSMPAHANDSLNDGLLVYFPFDIDETTSGKVTDKSTYGNDGTVIGTPTYEPDGVFGGAYYFAAQIGSSSGSWYRDYVTLEDNPTANVEELTVSLWIKTNTPGNS
jgi:hypothetical protein